MNKDDILSKNGHHFTKKIRVPLPCIPNFNSYQQIATAVQYSLAPSWSIHKAVDP